MKTLFTITMIIFVAALIKNAGGYDIPESVGYWVSGFVAFWTVLVLFMKGSSSEPEFITDRYYKGSYKHGKDLAKTYVDTGYTRGQIEYRLLTDAYPEDFKRGVRAFLRDELEL